jgi:DNA-binding NtrC family response regulator
MTVRTCLLVSDDPDDHAEIAEALYEIAEDIVVFVVSDATRAANLVLSKRHIPDYFIVDLAVNGFTHDSFFSSLETDSDFEAMFVLAYGDLSDYAKITTDRISAFMERDTAYSDVREFLRRVLEG